MKRGNFPRPVRISARSVGWPENEIDDFIADRIAERDARVSS
jgi:predicted DNA-binding transcriptional regulator AlpA